MGHTSPTHFTFELEEAWARPSGRRSAVSILSWVSVAGYLVLGRSSLASDRPLLTNCPF